MNLKKNPALFNRVNTTEFEEKQKFKQKIPTIKFSSRSKRENNKLLVSKQINYFSSSSYFNKCIK